MSISLNLVQYRHKNGELIEENLKTVRCEEISQSLLDKINSTFPMKTRKVYFDDALQDHFDIQCFENSDIESICKQLKELFLELLRIENNNLHDGKNDFLGHEKNSNNLVLGILSDEYYSNPTDLAIARFRILTGLIGLFMDMQTKLSDEIGAVIKLG